LFDLRRFDHGAGVECEIAGPAREAEEAFDRTDPACLAGRRQTAEAFDEPLQVAELNCPQRLADETGEGAMSAA
jgi:hypothetical protein